MQLLEDEAWHNSYGQMKFNLGQQLKTGQQLNLAPRIIQTMEIMQLPLPALEEKIAQELESNIALELADSEPDELNEERSEEAAEN